jgi:hypothetical protein
MKVGKIGAITTAGILAAMAMTSSIQHSNVNATTPTRAQVLADCKVLLNKVNNEDFAVEMVADPASPCEQAGFNVVGTYPHLYFEDCGTFANINWLGGGHGGQCGRQPVKLATTGGGENLNP